MNKKVQLFGAALATLLFSGFAIAHGVQNDSDGDIVYGHSLDHKDPAVINAGKAAPGMAHPNHGDDTDLIHQITVHKEDLGASPGERYDPRQVSNKETPNMIREVTAPR